METKSISALERSAILLIVWAILLSASFIFSVFLHEDGHGLGAKIDGVHVSTGFNKVGDDGKSPNDPDFRTGETENAMWSGLLGPITTWLLAIIFTVWLYRFKEPSWGALTVGALAIVNCLIRAVPMAQFLVSALRGSPYMEDEVGWGIWTVLKFCHPGLATSTLDYHVLVKTYAPTFLTDPTFWVPPLLSLTISLACLIPAYWRTYKLWGARFDNWRNRLLFGILPLATYFASWPVLNWLDRLIRINW